MLHNSDLPHISIVVPFFKSRRYIARCLDALVSQQYPSERYEVIMVDNNSPDGSIDIVRQRAGVKMVTERKQGAYAARNQGVREAQGDVIAFTDADCVVVLNWLSRIATAMADSELQILIGSHQSAGRGLFLYMLDAYENEKKEYTFSSGDRVLYHGHNNNMAVRRRLLEDMGGFIERPRGADTILVRRTVDRFGCDAVGHDPGMRVHHLEIDSVAVYLRKLVLYARTRRACQGIVQQRGLTNRERWHVYRRTVRRLGCSALQSVCLLALLTCGLAYCTVMSLLPMDDK